MKNKSLRNQIKDKDTFYEKAITFEQYQQKLTNLYNEVFSFLNSKSIKLYLYGQTLKSVTNGFSLDKKFDSIDTFMRNDLFLENREEMVSFCKNNKYAFIDPYSFSGITKVKIINPEIQYVKYNDEIYKTLIALDISLSVPLQGQKQEKILRYNNIITGAFIPEFTTIWSPRLSKVVMNKKYLWDLSLKGLKDIPYVNTLARMMYSKEIHYEANKNWDKQILIDGSINNSVYSINSMSMNVTRGIVANVPTNAKELSDSIKSDYSYPKNLFYSFSYNKKLLSKTKNHRMNICYKFIN